MRKREKYEKLKVNILHRSCHQIPNIKTKKRGMQDKIPRQKQKQVQKEII